MSQRELASLEDEIRRLAPIADRGRGLDNWMAQELGGSGYIYRQRWMLHRVDGVEELWERIENGLPIGTAVRMLRGARASLGTRARVPSVLRRAIADELAKHDKVATASTVVGKARAREAEAPAGRTWSNDREFWTFLRRNVLDYADKNLMDVPEMDRDQLCTDLERDLEALVKHHQQRWYSARRTGEKHVKVSKRKLSDALHALHMDLPRRGDDLKAFLRKAHNQMRQLARVYHPDSNRGDESLRPHYDAVITAYGTVQRWVGEQKDTRGLGDGDDEEPEPKPNLRVVQGGKKE
jgi:hypothetical protein